MIGGGPLADDATEGNEVRRRAKEEQSNLGSQSNLSFTRKRREQPSDQRTGLLRFWMPSCCCFDVRMRCRSKMMLRTNGRLGWIVRCCENATPVCLARRSRQNSEAATPVRSQKCRFSRVFSANGLSLAYSYLCGCFGPKDACRADGSPFPLGASLQQSGCDPWVCTPVVSKH